MNVTEWLRVPLVPTIWKMKVPVFADDATLIDIVELPGRIGLGEKPTWTPEGTPLLVERPTSALKPPIALTVTVAVVDWPCLLLTLEGVTVIVKSWGEETCKSNSVECSIMTAETPLPPDPVSEMG